MHYVSVEGLTKSYGVKPLFNNISFHIEEGDKIALVAKNGTGKSTLLKIIAGEEVPDSGTVWVHKDVKVVLLEQEHTFEEDLSVLDNIFLHDHPKMKVVRDYERAHTNPASTEAQLHEAITAMDNIGAWDFDAVVKQILGRLQITYLQQPLRSLSGGQRKRVALAKALLDVLYEPGHYLLIMDEPTNHLDVEMVEWLEYFLSKERITLLLVTHDRYFLDEVCNEILEMERETIFVHRGKYQRYLEDKAAREENEAANLAHARNQYRRELEWVRKQPKARTTKSKSRVDAFYELQERATQRMEQKKLELQVKMTRLGGKVLELKKVYKAFGEKTILKGFDYTFNTGEKVGVVGPNGVGKSTFVNMLLGLETQDSGKINIGETVVFGNFSQKGLEFKEDMRMIEYVKSFAEFFPLADGSKISAAQFLERFLFTPEQQYTYISRLSGGERRRLQLLTILYRNPNFMVLDEPTNDLDLPTLAILEEFLVDYPGCVVIVSHDRYFMDKIVDHLLVFEGEGQVKDFPGNFTDYREWVKLEEQKEKEMKETAVKKVVEATVAEKPASKKMSFKEKREFELLEKEIPQLETEKQEIEGKLSSGTTDYSELQKLTERIGEITGLLEEKELRWLELSEMA